MAWIAQRSARLSSLVMLAELSHERSIIRTAVSLSFKVLGDNPAEPDTPPVLIFHGLLGTKRHFEGLGKTILNMTRRPVVVADLRNHGDSPHVDSNKYTDQAEDILKLYEHLEIDRASLIGFSMGGRAVMAVALMEPKKVSGIIVVDISPVSSCPQLTEHIPKYLEAMTKVDFKGFSKDVKEARRTIRKQLRAAIPDEILLRAILANVRLKTGGAMGWTSNLDCLIKDFKYIADFPSYLRNKTYEGPTLFIGGQLSDFIPPDDLPEIRSMFPQAVVTYVKGAGHVVHADDPKTFLEYCIKFIRIIN